MAKERKKLLQRFPYNCLNMEISTCSNSVLCWAIFNMSFYIFDGMPAGMFLRHRCHLFY